MNPWTLKLISIPIVAVVNFISGFIPYYFISRKLRLIQSKHVQNSSTTQIDVLSPSMKRFLTLANFFCGGVFLSMCIIGLYPGVNTKFNRIIKKNPSISPYPYAGLSLACGFFFVWLLEILVHSCLHCNTHEHHVHSHGHSHGHSHISHSHDTEHNSNNIGNNTSNMIVMTPSIEEKLLNNCEEDEIKHVPESVDHEPHSHVPLTGNLLGSIMLTFALGSHSIIEGLGFGVMDELASIIYMLLTVLIHESVCAISLGVNIASRQTSIRPAIVLLSIFSILIPVGIGLGLIVDSSLQKNLIGEITIAVLQGVAAGTFIYVVFMEILPNEMSHRADALLRLFMMVLGFAVIAALKVTHSHGHSSLTNANYTVLPSTTTLSHTS